MSDGPALRSPDNIPTALVLAEVYLPGFMAGGPVRSIAGLVANLGKEFHWKIITTNRDLRSSAPYPEVASDCWVSVGNADVWYASAGRDGALNIINLIRHTPHNLLYLNSFFSPRFAIAPAIARKLGLLSRKPLLIAPRGEFSPGALALKRFKKALYLKFSGLFSVYKDAHWHASTWAEKKDVERVFGVSTRRIFLAQQTKQIEVAVDLQVNGRVPVRELRAASRPLRVCFLSRISRMKNLDLALRAVALVRQPVDFAIYGPKEDEAYWRECAALISDLPPHVKVIDGGVVCAQDVPSVLAEQDVFFLPTRGENFGHVLVEAWSAGLPVLVSDQTPWRDLEAKGIGWDLPLDEACLPRFAARIDELALRPPSDYVAMRERAILAAEAICSDPEAIQCNKRMFMAAAGYPSGPIDR